MTRIMTNGRRSLTLFSALVLVAATGCHKKAPPPPKPTINYFTAEPTTITSGQPSSLRWSVNDATNVEIDNGIGQVSPNGRRAVYPTATTTYHMTATGPGGTAEGFATVTVNAPPPPPPAPAAPQPTVQDILAHQFQDSHFDYAKSDIRPVDQPVLQADASALKQIFQMDPNFVVTIEGHCD